MVRPVFGVTSIALPVLVAASGALWLASVSNGNARMGILVLLIAVMGVVCLLGAVLGVVALFRGERWPWVAALGVLLNLGVVVQVAGVLFKK